jgi:hypothetical protein
MHRDLRSFLQTLRNENEIVEYRPKSIRISSSPISIAASSKSVAKLSSSPM